MHPVIEKVTQEIIKRSLSQEKETFKEYRLLISLCVQLVSIAYKQTRNVALSSEDTKFIKDYGGKLGNICFYGGNSWINPTRL